MEKIFNNQSIALLLCLVLVASTAYVSPIESEQESEYERELQPLTSEIELNALPSSVKSNSIPSWNCSVLEVYGNDLYSNAPLVTVNQNGFAYIVGSTQVSTTIANIPFVGEMNFIAGFGVDCQWKWVLRFPVWNWSRSSNSAEAVMDPWIFPAAIDSFGNFIFSFGSPQSDVLIERYIPPSLVVSHSWTVRGWGANGNASASILTLDEDGKLIAQVRENGPANVDVVRVCDLFIDEQDRIISLVLLHEFFPTTRGVERVQVSAYNSNGSLDWRVNTTSIIQQHILDCEYIAASFGVDNNLIITIAVYINVAMEDFFSFAGKNIYRPKSPSGLSSFRSPLIIMSLPLNGSTLQWAKVVDTIPNSLGVAFMMIPGRLDKLSVREDGSFHIAFRGRTFERGVFNYLNLSRNNPILIPESVDSMWTLFIFRFDSKGESLGVTHVYSEHLLAPFGNGPARSVNPILVSDPMGNEYISYYTSNVSFRYEIPATSSNLSNISGIPFPLRTSLRSTGNHDYYLMKFDSNRNYSWDIPLRATYNISVLFSIQTLGENDILFSGMDFSFPKKWVIVRHVDSDNDGIADPQDDCPDGTRDWFTPDNSISDWDEDGCEDAGEDLDDDNDGVLDGDDNCPTGMIGWNSNLGTDRDLDGCHNSEDRDMDNDGVWDGDDSCPNGMSWWTSNPQTDHDGDGCRDSDEDFDDDGDTVGDFIDHCPRGETGWISNSTTDKDSDGCRDAGEDDDDDNDGVKDPTDDCITPDFGWSSDRSTDYDQDGCQDALQDPDDDNDGRFDDVDDCPRGILRWRSESASDHDRDGCKDWSDEDLDDDNDGHPDTEDGCSRGDVDWHSDSDTDYDSDGCRDASEDEDDDSDSVLDVWDLCAKGELSWISNLSSDYDGDGCRDLTEDDDDDNDLVPDYRDSCPHSTHGWVSSPRTDLDGDGCEDEGVAGIGTDSEQSGGVLNGDGTSSGGADGGYGTQKASQVSDEPIINTEMVLPILSGLVLLTALGSVFYQPLRFDLSRRISQGGLLSLLGLTRTAKKAGNDTKGCRQEIFDYITNHPGAHFTDVVRSLHIGRGHAAHHLYALETKSEIWSHKTGRKLCFFPKTIPRPLLLPPYVDTLCQLTRADRDIIVFLHCAEGDFLPQSIIAERLELSQPTVSRRISLLGRKGLLGGEKQGRDYRVILTQLGRKIASFHSEGLDGLP